VNPMFARIGQRWWLLKEADALHPLLLTLLLGAAVLLVGLLLSRLLINALLRWTRHTDTPLDDAVLKHLRAPLRGIVPLTLFTLSLPLLTLPKGLEAGLRHVLGVSLTLLIGWLCFRSIRVLEDFVGHRYDVNQSDNLKARAILTQMRGLRNIAAFVIGTVTFGVALMSFDGVRQVGAGVLASAGVLGIVIGFAAQRSIATLLAGLQIALSQPIRVDDVVIVEGEWGRIEEVTLTYVVVRIWDLRRLIVPINYFIEKPFQNWTRTSAEVLGTVELHVDYSVDVEALRCELKRILEASPNWNQKVCGLQVTNSTEHSMVVRPLMSASDASRAWDLRCEVREKLITFLQREYPTALPRFRAELTGSLATTSSIPAGKGPT
jgi:small-conductance mechanosensitive channel